MSLEAKITMTNRLLDSNAVSLASQRRERKFHFRLILLRLIRAVSRDLSLVTYLSRLGKWISY